MHVLMISLDASLVTNPSSGALARHIAYAERAGKLSIIVYTPRGAGTTHQPTPHLTLIPTNSLSRYTFLLDAVRLGHDLIQRDRPSLITTQDPFVAGWVGWLLRGQANAPLLVQNHCYFIDNPAWLAENPLKHHPMNALGKFISSQADVYRTVNRRERETYLQHGGVAERVFTLPLGTASEAFIEPDPASVDALRARFGLKKINRVMLWVGYPVPFKRVPMLLQVFRRVRLLDPEARLLLIGDLSQSKEDLPALIQQLGIQTGVITAGQIAHQDLPAYYALAHTFVMTSAYEGVPRVLMEASAAALPLVAFDVVGVSEVIEDGINGYLIPNGDVVAMAARLVDLLHSPDRARVLGFSARSLGMERFSATRNPDAVAELWQQAVTLGRK